MHGTPSFKGIKWFEGHRIAKRFKKFNDKNRHIHFRACIKM